MSYLEGLDLSCRSKLARPLGSVKPSFALRDSGTKGGYAWDAHASGRSKDLGLGFAVLKRRSTSPLRYEPATRLHRQIVSELE